MYLIFATVEWIAIAVTAAQPQELPSLELIRAAYADQVDSIDSIEATLTCFDTYTTSLGVPSADGVRESATTILWAQRGLERRAEVTSADDSSQESPQRSWYHFDGRDTHIATWSGADGSVMGYRMHSGMTAFSMLQPDDILGCRLPNTEVRLVELLNRPECVIAGVESVSGQDCVKVDCGSLDGWHYAVWLDAAVGFLPRRIHVDLVVDAATSAHTTEQWREFTVAEFTRVSDPTRGVRSMPLFVSYESQRGLPDGSSLHSMRTITLLDVVVNQPVSDEAFHIDRPPGTTVIDARDAQQFRQYVAGTPEEIDRLASEQRAIAAKMLAEVESGAVTAVDATPRRSSLFLWFLAGSMLCFCVAIALRVRQSRSR